MKVTTYCTCFATSIQWNVSETSIDPINNIIRKHIDNNKYGKALIFDALININDA